MEGPEAEGFYLEWLRENVKAIPDVEIMIMVEPERLNLSEDFIGQWIGKKCPACGVPLLRREYVIGHHLADHFAKIST